MSSFSVDAAAALPGPEWLRARRRAAAETVAGRSAPTDAEEIWRYSRIGELDLDRFRPDGAAAHVPAAGTAPDGALPSAGRAVVDAVGPASAVVVVRNGRVVHAAVAPEVDGKRLWVGDAATRADGAELVGDAAEPVDLFTGLNSAFLAGAVVVDVPPGVTLEHPVVIVHWFDGDGEAWFPRTVVRAGRDSESTVVEHQASADVTGFVDPVVELHVDDAARLRYLNVQDLGPHVWQVAYQASTVGRDATLHSSAVAVGGDYARVRTDSTIVGRGGTSYLNAVYFADGRRMHDFRTLQDHAAPSSTSDLLFKGAVQDEGQSVYSGLIRVRKEGRGTNAFQTNRNLVLSEGAEAKSVPNLEIETDDVRCSHASAVGPVDEEQRYYLESRGIPPRVAERLMVMGFLGEVLDRLPAPALVDRLRAEMVARLGSAPLPGPELAMADAERS